MNDLPTAEFVALRHTVAVRGSLRLAIMAGGIAAWAAVLVAVVALVPNPLAALIPLVVLWTIFEVVRTTHLGVERIGRYLQVFAEDAAPDAPLVAPAWERTAMALGPTLPGAGGHPLFLPVFLMATLANTIAIVLPGPVAIEAGTLVVPHVAFVVWILYCDRGMRQQRRVEVARFHELKRGGH